MTARAATSPDTAVAAPRDGRLLGIARKARPRGPVETIDHAEIGLATGIAGDFRGVVRPGKTGRRQVTLMMADDWRAAMRDLDLAIDWHHRRVNLLVDGVVLPRVRGVLVRVGPVVLEITGECDPCSRMEEVAPGLRAALTPGWRGGRTARVLAAGAIRIGDIVSIEGQA